MTGSRRQMERRRVIREKKRRRRVAGEDGGGFDFDRCLCNAYIIVTSNDSRWFHFDGWQGDACISCLAKETTRKLSMFKFLLEFSFTQHTYTQDP